MAVLHSSHTSSHAADRRALDDTPLPACGHLLTSKLAVPLVRSTAITRERLFARLDDAVAHRLTIIAAPAGSGKTTLLASWAQCTRHPIGWLSLDPADNDPARFWAYFIAALRRVMPALGTHALAQLTTPGPHAIDAAVSTLAGELEAVTDSAHDDVVLVLNDYHAITCEAIHTSIAYLLDHLPPRLRLLIAGRACPPLPLARLRVAGELAELDAAALAFTPEEAAHFLRRALDLPVETAAAICARTEGWAAGLQLAALTLRDQVPLPEHVAPFTGDHRFVFDYFRDEVLTRQSTAVRDFLLATSVLDRFSASLCAHVTGDAHATERLMQLERDNLFLVPLDEQRQWYRYHQLFADALRAQLHKEGRRRLRLLHRRAAQWHERNGTLDEAVRHAFAADDPEWVSRIIERAALDLLGKGQWATVFGWIEALPADLVRSRAGLSLLCAWALLLAEELESVEPHLSRAEALLENAQGSASGAHAFTAPDDMRGFIATARAALAQSRQDSPEMMRQCERALVLLASDNWQIRGHVAGYLGSAYWTQGNAQQAERWLEESVRTHERAGNTYPALSALCVLALVRFDQGKLTASRRAGERVITMPVLPGRYMAWRVLAATYREEDDLDAAESCLRDAIAMATKEQAADARALNMLSLVRTLWPAGKRAEALEALEQVERSVREGVVSQHVAQRAAICRARAALAWGDLATARAWAETCGLLADGAIPPALESDYLIYARVLLAQGNTDAALKVAQRVEQAAQAQRRNGTLVEALAVEAQALHAHGHAPIALAALDQALALAEPEGMVGVFADEGQPMADLLEELRTRQRRPRHPLTVSAAFLSRTLAATYRRIPRENASSPIPTQSLLEPLSPRELEVLQYLSAGCSNAEIAGQLVVALSTVKTHLNNIYGKLGVRSRTQALVRAQELELLARHPA